MNSPIHGIVRLLGICPGDRPGWYPIDKCGPYNCVQAAAILRAVGVLPSPTGAAA